MARFFAFRARLTIHEPALDERLLHPGVRSVLWRFRDAAGEQVILGGTIVDRPDDVTATIGCWAVEPAEQVITVGAAAEIVYPPSRVRGTAVVTEVLGVVEIE